MRVLAYCGSFLFVLDQPAPAPLTTIALLACQLPHSFNPPYLCLPPPLVRCRERPLAPVSLYSIWNGVAPPLKEWDRFRYRAIVSPSLLWLGPLFKSPLVEAGQECCFLPPSIFT